MADRRDAWRTVFAKRTALTLLLFGIWAVAVQARLVYLHVFAHEKWRAMAENQITRHVKVAAKRGEIVDRDGRVLALSVDEDTIYAVPSQLEDPAGAAARLCAALDRCSADYQRTLTARFAKSSSDFAFVQRRASPEEARRVAALNMKGVAFLKESRRWYPKRELAAHVLGFVDIDDKGLEGLEATYDKEIRGQDGEFEVLTDANQKPFLRQGRPPVPGATLELTLDERVQHIVERELQAGVARHNAAGASAIVMNPRTGEILAVANYPTFNANARGAYDDKSVLRNRAVEDYYEPGSTFKLVTASAAIEEGVMSVDDPIDVSAGLIRFGSRVIDDVHRYGVLTFTGVIVKSSNVGAIKIGLELGAHTLDRYVRRFGFGRRLSREFRGESAGSVWNPGKVNDSALASISMGYQVGVTPLQMAAAVSSVANGGELLQPRIVRAVIDPSGRRTEFAPKVLGRSIKPSTAAQLTTIMELVVEEGTGTTARIPGYTVAGKTGTAQKLIDNRYYSDTDYKASFVGFVPSRRPVFTIIVVVDTPRKGGYYGGTIAGPIFQRIAESVLTLYGVPPSMTPAMPVLVARRQAAEPVPVPASAALRPAVPAPDVPQAAEGTIPDLTGLGAREAIRALANLGMVVERVHGQGVVVEQNPPAGAPIDEGAACVLRLGRVPAAPVGPGTSGGRR